VLFHLHLKIVNEKEASSFQEATLSHGLLESDNYIEQCLVEASIYQTPYTLKIAICNIVSLL